MPTPNLYNVIVFILIAIGIFFRAYNLNWGTPYSFHPDELNLIILLQQKHQSLWELFQAGTFSYGNFSNILLVIVKQFLEFFQVFSVDLDKVLLRYQSLLYSTASIILIYFTGRMWSKKVALLSLSLTVFSVGLIQQSHFGTLDTMIMFYTLLSFYTTLLYIKKKKKLFIFLAFLFVALATAAKISSIMYIAIPIIGCIFTVKNWGKLLFLIPLFSSLTICLAILFSPYYLTEEFKNLFQYERDLVTGVALVFYTQSFFNTVPIVFQFFNIYPFQINPVLTLLLLPAIITLFFARDKKNLLLLISFFILFLPQAVLFAKWGRYIIPTIPFALLILSVALYKLCKNNARRYVIFGVLLSSFSFIFAFAYFITVLSQTDTRISAAKWASKNIHKDSNVLIESHDPGANVFINFRNVTYFDFYNVEKDYVKQNLLYEKLKTQDYIILPSQRILRSRLQNTKEFPFGNNFYKKLFSDTSNFTLVYKTDCDFFCKILYLGDPIFWNEETLTVFDRPTIFIFKINNGS